MGSKVRVIVKEPQYRQPLYSMPSTGDPGPIGRIRVADYLREIGAISFPASHGININMMPFKIGDRSSLPPEYQHYWPLIEACGIEAQERGKTGYLSITETDVESNKSQRRPGIHTDGAGSGRGRMGWGSWGKGLALSGERRQGIYLASTVERSCRAWNLSIETSLGAMGDCSEFDLDEDAAIYLKPQTLYWMTDAVPHQSLPLEQAQHRQWFRVVTSPVSVWYERHSTPNRLGVAPACRIIEGDKFGA